VSPGFLEFLLEMADSGPATAPGAHSDLDQLRRAFFAAVPAAERTHAEEMLELARASHRWRDDDNVYLDAVEAQWRAAREELSRRAGKGDGRRGVISTGSGEDEIEAAPAVERSEAPSAAAVPIAPRQLVGQPAGPGVATGSARVALGQEDLLQFKRGEVLVCDALNPTMTFVIPLASAVVERRGGMLIHGAIIAREYGIPCVTGVPDAARLIRTGTSLTVDGYLGIVRIQAT
jgi:pyruvate,water dikinase